MTFFRPQVLETALLPRAGPRAQETGMVHWWWERNFLVSVFEVAVRCAGQVPSERPARWRLLSIGLQTWVLIQQGRNGRR